jgi:hypothetical protein
VSLARVLARFQRARFCIALVCRATQQVQRFKQAEAGMLINELCRNGRLQMAIDESELIDEPLTNTPISDLLNRYRFSI